MKDEALFDEYKLACNFENEINAATVEENLKKYLLVFKADKKVQQIKRGWKLSDYPDIVKYVLDILDEARQDSRNDIPERDELLKNIDDLHKFACECIARSTKPLWASDLSWLSTLHFGALEKNDGKALKWSEPAIQAFLSGAWLVFWTENTLFWCARPETIHFVSEKDKTVHCETGPALPTDICDIYFFQGWPVKKHVVMNPSLIKIEEITKEQNKERQRILIDRFGVDKYLAEIGAKPKHVDSFGELYDFTSHDGIKTCIVKVKDATIKNGNQRTYYLQTPETETAHEAVAATFGMKPSEYLPDIET